MKPSKFLRLPVVMEAIQYTGGFTNYHDIKDFVGPKLIPYMLHPGKQTLGIESLEGIMEVSVGDWVVKGIKGEFWPVKPDIFELTYAPVKYPNFVEKEEDGN
jgi:hypothetical protein